MIYKVEKLYIPISLLELACTETKVGDTVRSLAVAYISDRSCLRAHMELIEGLKRTYTNQEGLSKEGS